MTESTDSSRSPAAHDDLVERVFTADAPNQLWLTDITEHWTGGGKLYPCAIKDLYSNRIVGYSIDDRMTASLAVTALDSAVARRGDVAGYISCTRTEAADFDHANNSVPSPRTGWSARWAKSAPPATTQRWNRSSPFLQKDVLGRQRWDTRDELRIAIVTWIERTDPPWGGIQRD